MAAVLVDVGNGFVHTRAGWCNRECYSLSEVGRNGFHSLVISRQAVDATLDENQTEFGVLVRSVGLQMFADGHGLLDEIVQIFGYFRGQTCKR